MNTTGDIREHTSQGHQVDQREQVYNKWKLAWEGREKETTDQQMCVFVCVRAYYKLNCQACKDVPETIGLLPELAWVHVYRATRGRQEERTRKSSLESSGNYFSSDHLANRSTRRKALTIITLDACQVCIQAKHRKPRQSTREGLPWDTGAESVQARSGKERFVL